LVECGTIFPVPEGLFCEKVIALGKGVLYINFHIINPFDSEKKDTTGEEEQ